MLSRATHAIASKVQVPEAIAAQSVLATAALAAQPHADVVLPFGQTRPLSLFLVTIAASGDRKSSADNEALRPIHMHEKGAPNPARSGDSGLSDRHRRLERAEKEDRGQRQYHTNPR